MYTHTRYHTYISSRIRCIVYNARRTYELQPRSVRHTEVVVHVLNRIQCTCMYIVRRTVFNVHEYTPERDDGTGVDYNQGS